MHPNKSSLMWYLRPSIVLPCACIFCCSCTACLNNEFAYSPENLHILFSLWRPSQLPTPVFDENAFLEEYWLNAVKYNVILAEKDFQILFKTIFITMELVLKLEGTLQFIHLVIASFYIWKYFKFMLSAFRFRLCHWIVTGHVGFIVLIFK